VTAADIRRAYRRAIVRLRPDDGHLFFLRLEGVPQHEIARALGVTQQAVSQRLARARRRLRVLIMDVIEGRWDE